MPNFGRALLEFFEKRGEPSWELASLGGESGEPHLPVEAGLEGGDLGREAIGGAGFVGEKDGIPAKSVGTAFEGDFGAASGHDGEESVTGGEVPGGERVLPWGARGAGKKLESGKEDRNSERELEESGEGGEMSP